MTTEQQINEQVRAAVAETGVSPTDLGRAIGIHRVTASQWLHGSRDLSLDRLDRAARLAGRRVDVQLKKSRKKSAPAP